jgi:hypothetical protein
MALQASEVAGSAAGGTSRRYLPGMDLRDVVALGLAPTPATIAPFLVEVLGREGSMSRIDLVCAVEGVCATGGRAPVAGNNTESNVEEALSTLVRQGVVENPGHAVYRLAAAPDDSTDDMDLFEPDEVEGSGDPEVELGDGVQAVYAYYLPTSRELAVGRGESRWAMSVGMTTTHVTSRMSAHIAALPEVPALGLVIRTDHGTTLERVIHGVLTLRGRRLEDSGGSEWFLTNLDELRDIYLSTVEPQTADAGSPSLVEVAAFD